MPELLVLAIDIGSSPTRTAPYSINRRSA